MACQFDTNRKCFSFTWILENFEYCEEKTGEELFSPPFIVETMARSKWGLSLYPRGEESEDWISIFLWREKDSKGPATVTIDFELAFLDTDGAILASAYEIGNTFQNDKNSGFPLFLLRKSVTAKPSKYLPQGELIVRCRMWKSAAEVNIDGQCIARTRIGVERKIFFWKIQNFSHVLLGAEIILRLKSTSDDKPIATLKRLLRYNGSSYEIYIILVNSNQSIEFSTLKSSLVDSDGHYEDCGCFEFWFSPTVQKIECRLPLERETLIDNKWLYLPNDTLTIHCECVFSSGVMYEKIEETSYGCTRSFITNSNVSENINTFDNAKSDLNTSSYLKMDLGSMLQDNILCDVKLCTESDTFPAHWFILTSRSPVFRAMFKSDMKEKSKDKIDITDLKPDTVRRMLLYMYTDSLEELQWEIAADLYAAAEKYQIMSLKNQCSSFLKTNLSFTNVCEILLLADLYQDAELKYIIQDYILKNDKSIINSSEWKLLMEANLKLAADTLILRYKR